MYSAYGEAEANQLAREWRRKGHFVYKLWIDSGGVERFTDVDEFKYVEDLSFLDWAVGVDASSPVWSKIMELRAAMPGVG